jgi:hypothetical protein
MGHWLSINNPAPPLIRPLRWATPALLLPSGQGTAQTDCERHPIKRSSGRVLPDDGKTLPKITTCMLFLKIMTNRFLNITNNKTCPD